MEQDVDRFLHVLATERGLTSNTVVAYRNDLGQFIEFLAGVDGQDAELAAQREQSRIAGYGTVLADWPELSEHHVTRYLLHLREREYAASTIARKTAAIKSFCHFLLTEGRLRHDPAAAVASPKVDKMAPRAISVEEMRLLLAAPFAAVDGDGSRPEAVRDHAMLHTLYATGIRVSELVALDVEDLQLDHNRLLAGPAKRRREVGLDGKARTALGQYLDGARGALDLRGEPALFLNHRGSRLTRQGFWLLLKTHALTAGIADITPHTLRHTFAAHRLLDGASLAEVQQLLGHVNISTTQMYRRVTGGQTAKTNGESRSTPATGTSLSRQVESDGNASPTVAPAEGATTTDE